MKIEEREKIYGRIFKYIFLLLLITFLTLYFSQVTGYSEFKQHKKVVYTAEQIKKFEADVAAGKDVHIEDYMETKEKNYINKASKLGLSISEGMGNIVKKGIDDLFSAISEIVEE